MSLDELVDKAHTFAEGVLVGKKDAAVCPTFAVQFKSRPAVILATPWSSQRERDAFLDAVEITMARMRDEIVAYSVVSEAWVATQAHPFDETRDLMPSQRETRKEVVFACATDGSRKRFDLWKIVRDGDAVVTALAPSQMEGWESLGELDGRMLDLLKPRTP